MLFSKYAKYSTRRFCPVCKKNGRPEEEFNGHNTRDEDDNIICPILIKENASPRPKPEVVCHSCGERGHIASKCSKQFFPKIPSPPVSPPVSPKSEPVVEKNFEDSFPALASKPKAQTETKIQYSNVASIAKQEIAQSEVKKPKHYSPTCEEIEDRLRRIVLEDAYKNQHANNIYGRTLYLTHEQIREKIRNGEDIDEERVYVVDDGTMSDYDEPYEYIDNGGGDYDEDD